MHGRVINFSKAYLTQILMFPEHLSRVLLQRLLNMIRWIEASALILLTILAPCISESCIQIKLIVTLLCGASKGSIEAFQAFIKPFETPKRSVKIKI